MKLPKPRGGVEPKNLLQAIQSQRLKMELNIPQNATVLLSVGEVNKNKNHKVVIEALQELKGCYYVLCGRGPLMDEHRKLAEHLGVTDRFIMTGYRTDVADFYNMADVFVFPSYREGLPVALMEAMAAGIPCVAARNRGTDDLLENSELLFDSCNVSRVKRIIEQLNDDIKSKEVLRNRESLNKYSIVNTESEIKHLYENSTKDKRSRNHGN